MYIDKKWLLTKLNQMLIKINDSNNTMKLWNKINCQDQINEITDSYLGFTQLLKRNFWNCNSIFIILITEHMYFLLNNLIAGSRLQPALYFRDANFIVYGVFLCFLNFKKEQVKINSHWGLWVNTCVLGRERSWKNTTWN